MGLEISGNPRSEHAARKLYFFVEVILRYQTAGYMHGACESRTRLHNRNDTS